MASHAPPKMGRELQSALGDDALAKARNDAKLRAVTQRVDYDTFKQMVSVAHLRPLQAPNTRADGWRAPAWGFDADGAAASSAAPAPACGDGDASASPSDAPQVPPASGLEFERAWRGLSTPRARVALLRRTPPASLPALFKVEVSHALLGEMLAALRLGWRGLADGQAAACAAAAALLRGVAGAGRFALAARLLGGAARQHAVALLADLLAAGGDADGLAALRRDYGVEQPAPPLQGA